MTKKEEKLLDELKDFFTTKYKKDWEEKFKKYTKKLVTDGHILQDVIDDYLEYEEPNEIVKKFNEFTTKKIKSVQTTKSSPSVFDGCSGSIKSDGYGNTNYKRTYSDPCSGGGYSGRSSC